MPELPYLNLPTCHPPTRLQKLDVNSKQVGPIGLQLLFPITLQGSACGTFVDLTLRRDKKADCRRSPGPPCASRSMLRVGANATAPKGANPRRDRGTFVLKCLPRTTPCPTGTTTATTTLAGGTTTTTNQAISMGCSFKNGECTGSCAPGSRCGAAAGTGSCECRLNP